MLVLGIGTGFKFLSFRGAGIGLKLLQVEREGLGPAPGYILLWDRKSHALAKMKTK